jgi:ribosomal protein S18 acetylase RimI-like enzyme
VTTIKFVDELGTEIEAKMRRDLEKYESSHGIDVNYKQFALVLTDKYDNAIGVLNAFTAFAEISVCDLWVEISHRRKGYGRQLLQFLENHFKDKGFNNINLITSQFQAPEFYKKCGFELEFVRKNIKNPNLSKSFFIKYFDDEIQTQGTLPKA